MVTAEKKLKNEEDRSTSLKATYESYDAEIKKQKEILDEKMGTLGEILKTASTGDSKSKPKDVILSRDEKTIYVAGGRANKIIIVDKWGLIRLSN